MAHRITYLSKETKTIQRIKGLFICLFFPLFLTAQCAHPDDYKALRSLYLTTDGSNWKNKMGWPNRTFFINNVNIPPNTIMSNWYGVTCTNGRVTSLNLNNNGLNGTIPNFVISELKTLILDQNQLIGNIPNLKLPKLEILSLHNNSLIGKIPNFDFLSLNTLDLSNNELSGYIPTLDMPNLELLILNNNDLIGSIPNFKLPKLETLSLRFNKLTGLIPNFDFPNLKILFLSNNMLSDEIPNFNLPLLSHLSLDYNSLSGLIPNFNLPILQTLYLNNNKLSGIIPDLNIPQIQKIDLSNNNLIGRIPNFNFGNLYLLYLNHNNLQGCIPSNFKVFCDSVLINDPIQGDIKVKPDINLIQNGKLPWSGNFNSFCNSDGTILGQVGAKCGYCEQEINLDSQSNNCICKNNNAIEIKLEGIVFVDIDVNGEFNLNDIPLEGVSISAYPDCNKTNVPITVKTDKNGRYTFEIWQLQTPPISYLITIDPNSNVGCDANISECVELPPCDNIKEIDPIMFPCPPPNCAENPYSYGNNCDAAYENPLCDLRVIGEFPCGQNPSELGPWNNQQHCQGTYKNTSFFGFVAGSGAYDIQFTIFNCAGKGVQYGIMDACNPDGPFILCNGNSTGNGFTVTIYGGLLEPCKNYVFWINGFEGSVCSYYASVIGDWNNCDVPNILDLKLDFPCTSLCPSLNPVTLRAIPEQGSIPAIEEINGAVYNWTISGPDGVVEYNREGPEGITLNHTFSEAGTYTVCLSTYHPCDGDSPNFCKTFTFENIENDYREFKICNTDFPWSGAFDTKNKPLLDKHGNQWKWLGGNITLQMVKNGVLNFSSLYENACGCTYNQSFRISTNNLCAKDNGTLQVDSTNFPTDSIFSEILEDAKPSISNDFGKTNYQVFPNPTNGKVFITPDQPTAFKVDVYSMSGLPLESSLVESKTQGLGFELSLDHLPQAMYLIRIIDDNGFSYHRVMKY